MALDEFGCHFKGCGKADTCERYLYRNSRTNHFRKVPYNKYDKDTIACYFYKRVTNRIGKGTNER